MTVDEILSELRPRAQNLRLVDPSTGYASAEEIRFYLKDALRHLSTQYQLSLFLDMNRELLRTADGIEDYDIPDTFWGWWAPDDERTSGLSIADTVAATTTTLASVDDNPMNLRYREPARYHIERTADEDKPSIFTIANNRLYFSPVPDAVYVIQGVHRTDPASSDTVANPYVQAVKIQTLYRMAEDKGRLTQELATEHRDVIGRLVNNDHRQRQQFKRPYTDRIGFGRYTRRYGTGGW